MSEFEIIVVVLMSIIALPTIIAWTGLICGLGLMGLCAVGLAIIELKDKLVGNKK